MDSIILGFGSIILICAIVLACIKHEAAQTASAGLFRVAIISILVGIAFASAS